MRLGRIDYLEDIHFYLISNRPLKALNAVKNFIYSGSVESRHLFHGEITMKSTVTIIFIIITASNAVDEFGVAVQNESRGGSKAQWIKLSSKMQLQQEVLRCCHCLHHLLLRFFLLHFLLQCHCRNCYVHCVPR